MKLRTELDQMHRELSILIEDAQRTQIYTEANANVRQSSRAREIDQYEMEELVRESTLGQQVNESEYLMNQMTNSFQPTMKKESNLYTIETTQSGRMIKKPIKDIEKSVSVKTYKKEVQDQPRKSENRFYRIDNQGNKQYVNINEQRNLEQLQRDPSQKRT